MFPDQRNEAAGDVDRDGGQSFFFGDELEELGIGGADGDDEAPGVFELGEENGGERGGRGGNKDGVVGSVLGEAERAVSDDERDVAVVEVIEDGLGVLGERRVTLDGIDMGAEFGEEGGLVSRAGSDFEDGVGGSEAKEFEHKGDDVGLGDGLGFGYGERAVVVGVIAEGRADEFVARDLGHGDKDARVADAALGKLVEDHALAELGEIEVGGHGIGLRLRATCRFPRLASKERRRTWGTGRQDCSCCT